MHTVIVAHDEYQIKAVRCVLDAWEEYKIARDNIDQISVVRYIYGKYRGAVDMFCAIRGHKCMGFDILTDEFGVVKGFMIKLGNDDSVTYLL